MKRSELEHILRTAGAISGVHTFVVVGSQAILGSYPHAPAALLVSQEADLYAPDDEAASDLIDGSIGEGSPFQDAFGYYAHGVGPETAILPVKWQDRSVRIETPDTVGVVGICPHPSDLAISKLAAGREKDRKFVEVLLREGLVEREELVSRVAELDPQVAELVARRLEAF